MSKYKKRREDPFDTPQYHKLVEDIKKIINDAAAQGCDIFRRDDILTCKACGCYEDVLFSGEWVICDSLGKVVSDKEFIIIGRKERSYRRAKTTYYKITFDFICSQCGARQEETIRESFEDSF
jgi:hypothetical protein